MARRPAPAKKVSALQASLFGAPVYEPPMHYCACGKWGSFGLQLPGAETKWFCRAHVPAGFLPGDRK